MGYLFYNRHVNNTSSHSELFEELQVMSTFIAYFAIVFLLFFVLITTLDVIWLFIKLKIVYTILTRHKNDQRKKPNSLHAKSVLKDFYEIKPEHILIINREEEKWITFCKANRAIFMLPDTNWWESIIDTCSKEDLNDFANSHMCMYFLSISWQRDLVVENYYIPNLKKHLNQYKDDVTKTLPERAIQWNKHVDLYYEEYMIYNRDENPFSLKRKLKTAFLPLHI